jgi:hypothetical protein
VALARVAAEATARAAASGGGGGDSSASGGGGGSLMTQRLAFGLVDSNATSSLANRVD